MARKIKRFPHNLHAETSVLGGILIDNEALPRVQGLLGPEDFYEERNRKVFLTMIELANAHQPIDLVTLGDALERKGWLEEVGGIARVSNLTDSVPVTTNLEQYARLIREKFILRQLLQEMREASAQVLESDLPFGDLVEGTEARIFAVTRGRTTSALEQVGPGVEAAVTALHQRLLDGRQITGVCTGLEDLDRMLGGLQKKDLIILAARPSMGKTAFALNIAESLVMSGEAVAIFSLEMGKEQLLLRMLAGLARVNVGQVMHGAIDESMLVAIARAADQLYDRPLYIDETPGISIQELRGKARRLAQTMPLSLVMVDYLQLMSGSPSARNSKSRELEISEISRGLKALAKELNVPVIALSQLNRKLEERRDKRPMMSDLRESGAIEQDADVIMFLYRRAVYKDGLETMTEEELERATELIVAKHRNGGTGTIDAVFLKEYARFVNLAKR